MAVITFPPDAYLTGNGDSYWASIRSSVVNILGTYDYSFIALTSLPPDLAEQIRADRRPDSVKIPIGNLFFFTGGTDATA